MNKVTRGRHRQGQWWLVIVNYLGSRCQYCGSFDGLMIHHAIPLENGGPNIMSNLELVCRECHSSLHKELRKVFADTRVQPKRKTHCKRGHEIIRDIHGNGKCRICKQLLNRHLI